MANDNNIPKGPSNSNTFAPTPGTQQTAAQNVGFTGANINPNMPRGPQLARQGRSSYQRSITPAGPRTPMGMGGQRPRRTGMGRKPVVSRGMPMDAGRGYNMFSGMDANQIGQMNSSMGLSNMTALPSLVGAVDPRLNKDSFANRGPEGWGGENPQPAGWWTDFKDGVGDVINYASGGAPAAGQILEEGAEYVEDEMAKANAETAAAVEDAESKYGSLEEAIAAVGAEPDPDPILLGELEEALETNKSLSQGFDPEKMAALEAQLDDKYARQLQAVMAGVDRQAAMMGAWGGGGHSTMINNAIATSLGQMADEYAKLGLADMQQSKLDETAQMDRTIKLAELIDAYNDTMGDAAAQLALTDEMNSIIFGASTSAVMKLDSGPSSFFMGPLNQASSAYDTAIKNAKSGAEVAEINDYYKNLGSDFAEIVELYSSGQYSAANILWAQWYDAVFPGEPVPKIK